MQNKFCFGFIYTKLFLQLLMKQRSRTKKGPKILGMYKQGVLFLQTTWGI